MRIRWLKIESKVKRTSFTKIAALFVGLKIVFVSTAIIRNDENKLALCQISQAFRNKEYIKYIKVYRPSLYYSKFHKIIMGSKG